MEKFYVLRMFSSNLETYIENSIKHDPSELNGETEDRISVEKNCHYLKLRFLDNFLHLQMYVLWTFKKH